MKKKDSMKEPIWLTVAEVAERLNMRPKDVRAAARRGIVEFRHGADGMEIPERDLWRFNPPPPVVPKNL